MSESQPTAKELYLKYQDLVALSKTNLNSIPINVRAGREGQIRAAAEESAKVARQYRELVTKNAVIIAASGPFSEQFALKAQELNQAMALNYLDAADTVAKRVVDRGYPDRYDSRTFHMSMDEILKLKAECGIFSTPQLQQLTTTGLMTLRDGMRETIKKSLGGQLYTLVTKNSIGLAALTNGFVGNNLAVVVYNYDNDIPIDAEFMAPPMIMVDCATEESSLEDKVMGVISELKEKMFGTKKKMNKKRSK